MLRGLEAAVRAADPRGPAFVQARDRFVLRGFRPAAELGVTPPAAEWEPHFMAQPLTGHDPTLRGEFAYAAPFMTI